MSSDRRNSRLRRLSDSTAKLLRQLRLIRSDSGYGSDDQRERRNSTDAVAADDAPSSSRDEQRQSFSWLPSHDELLEFSAAESEKEEEEEGGFFEDAAEEQKVRQLSKSERHLISVRFALLREQGRTYHTLWLADCLEEEELSEKQREEEAERLKRELSLRQKDVDLFQISRRRRTSSASSYAEGDDYLESQLQRRRHRRRENEWRQHWSMRTSNWMYGGGYRNTLDYWY